MLVSIKLPDGRKVPFDSLPEEDQLRVKKRMGEVVLGMINYEIGRMQSNESLPMLRELQKVD